MEILVIFILVPFFIASLDCPEDDHLGINE